MPDERRPAAAPPPQASPDCMECRLIGSGAMLGLSGWFFYHAQGVRTARTPAHYFNAALGVCFAGAAVARWLV
jgi:hypothetical protein